MQTTSTPSLVSRNSHNLLSWISLKPRTRIFIRTGAWIWSTARTHSQAKKAVRQPTKLILMSHLWLQELPRGLLMGWLCITITNNSSIIVDSLTSPAMFLKTRVRIWPNRRQASEVRKTAKIRIIHSSVELKFPIQRNKSHRTLQHLWHEGSKSWVMLDCMQERGPQSCWSLLWPPHKTKQVMRV